MPRKKEEKALIALTQLWNEAASHNRYAPLNDIEFTSSVYKRKQSGNKRYIPRDDVSVNPKVFENTTSLEQSMIIEIVQQLKKNNALWFYDYRTHNIRGRSTKERAILALRRKRVLYKTELNSLHLVNPLMIRRGAIETVIAATYELLSTEKTRSPRDYKHLTPPRSTSINLYLALR